MAARIEDYALIGDCQTAALVSRDGSIDWLCLPRFDSGACFAALLGRPEHGRWQVAPLEQPHRIDRRYTDGTLILETIFVTEDGEVALLDFMPPRSDEPNLVRIVEGRRGTVKMRLHLVIRFDYGSIVPWVRRTDRGIRAIAGPDQVELQTAVQLRGEALTTVAEFTVAEGQRVPFVLQWQPSHEELHEALDAEQALADSETWWHNWSSGFRYDGPYRDAVLRSLITLKALTYAPTGGIVAAATTSLPEQLGATRNWDYRMCWLRDATFTLYALMAGGFQDEAIAWRNWLLRAVAGDPSQINIVYGLAGERRLIETEIGWLPGYETSAPVRVGNAAYTQLQLDIFGELMDSMHLSRKLGLDCDENAWRLQKNLIEHMEKIWRDPDEGIWEVRGPRRHFTHSKVMAWVAADRMVKAVEQFNLEGPSDHWRRLRNEIHADVCANGFNSQLNSFVQYYGAKEPDGSLLTLPLVGFLPPDDPRIRGTVELIERRLVRDGFVARYLTREMIDGLPPGEGCFLPCSFWLADNYCLQGRYEEADVLFERLLGLANDVGLISEEYDPARERLVGNFPQAFTHVALVNTAMN
ncbi:MAG TPA: glycoside hydrolase family 15 protein, partial [Blastocatellia bacterium]|nr:glycoside hydrolase family 15 protein [Blastocatellia bacterium]